MAVIAPFTPSQARRVVSYQGETKRIPTTEAANVSRPRVRRDHTVMCVCSECVCVYVCMCETLVS